VVTRSVHDVQVFLRHALSKYLITAHTEQRQRLRKNFQTVGRDEGRSPREPPLHRISLPAVRARYAHGVRDGVVVRGHRLRRGGGEGGVGGGGRVSHRRRGERVKAAFGVSGFGVI